jgi:dihydroorotate dehydrogenase
MPDWSYRTVFRPLLFQLPPRTARELALGMLGFLARTPGGTRIIDFLGHLQPPAALERSLLGMKCLGPVGLAGDVDVNATALRALARFGFGFIEVGPVTLQPIEGPLERRLADQSLYYLHPPPNPGAAVMADRLRRWGKLPMPVLVRIDEAAAALAIAPFADAVVLTIASFSDVAAVREAVPGKPILLAIAPNLDDGKMEAVIETAIPQGVTGVVVDGVLRTEGGCLAGATALDAALHTVQRLRERWGERLCIIAGGVHEPEHALLLRQAGANFVQISTGLIYSGPGLPKRVNDAWLYAERGRDIPHVEERAPEMTWFWMLLMGIGMLIGSLMAVVIAATRVVLPYDEVFSGMSRDQLDAINPRLLAFMAHDRVSLAGTMVTVGVLYPLLSWFGIRRGMRWAKLAVLASAFSGFASFFLFLGFGYFDPFHAFVTVVLFQFLLLGLHCKIAEPQPVTANLREDWRWRWCQWAQLLFIIHNLTLIVAGCVLSFVGSTHVFVHEDLEFMQTTAEALRAANPRLVPLVAHDRAGLGGMAIAAGIGLLLPSLWGFRQGERWLWWTFLAAVLPAYVAAIGVHFVVGYTNLWHLMPAFGGAGLFALALALSYPYLTTKNQSPLERKPCNSAASAAPD